MPGTAVSREEFNKLVDVMAQVGQAVMGLQAKLDGNGATPMPPTQAPMQQPAQAQAPIHVQARVDVPPPPVAPKANMPAQALHFTCAEYPGVTFTLEYKRFKVNAKGIQNEGYTCGWINPVFGDAEYVGSITFTRK